MHSHGGKSRFRAQSVPERGNYCSIGIETNKVVPCRRIYEQGSTIQIASAPAHFSAQRDDCRLVWRGNSAGFSVQALGSAGLSLAASITRPVGSSLMLVFEVPGGVVQAEVFVRSITPGKEMGLEFTPMGDQARALLYDLLKWLLR